MKYTKFWKSKVSKWGGLTIKIKPVDLYQFLSEIGFTSIEIKPNRWAAIDNQNNQYKTSQLSSVVCTEMIDKFKAEDKFEVVTVRDIVCRKRYEYFNSNMIGLLSEFKSGIMTNE